MTAVPMARGFGRAVRCVRVGRRMSQSQLAEAVGTQRPLVSRIERGCHAPTLYTMARYADALGVPLGNLLGVAAAFGRAS